MIKEFLENRQRKIQEKKRLLKQAMKSEIINAIQKEVREEQKFEKVSIPYFLEVQRRINDLKIVTVQDLRNVYHQFAKQGRVSGVINV